MWTIPAKTILSAYMECGWFGSNYNMNLYKGCCHGCIYCDSRSDCYGVADFDSVRVKENAAAIVESELRRKRKNGTVITGSMSDPYNPFEAELRLTRRILELFDRYRYGVVVLTKSALAARDCDVLAAIARHSPAVVNFTVTCADDSLCRKLEQSVSVSSERLSAISKLTDEGITCGMLLMPILPLINDTEENIRGVVRLAHEAGAKWVYVEHGFGVTLRQNQRLHFLDKAEELFPGMRKQYVERFGNEYSCQSPNNDSLWKTFTSECERLGMAYRMRDIIRIIHGKYECEQLSMF